MTVESIRKATELFLKTIEEEGVYKFNSSLFSDYGEHFKNWSNRRNLFLKTLEKIANKVDGTLSDEESETFMVQISIWNLASILELIKFFLMLLVNKEKIDLDPEKAMYGQVIESICKEIGYDETTKKTTLDNFMVDFRNAIFHNKYNIENGGIIYKNYDNQSVILTNLQLSERNNEASVILESLTAFADKKSDEVDRMTKKLLKEKAELDRKLRDLS